MISANTASRHEGWFRLEWDLADQPSHMMARSRVFVVPVCFDGFKEEGIRRECAYLKGEYDDMKCFGLIRSEFSED